MHAEQCPSDTGSDGKTTGSISRASPPFNHPTNVAIGSRGDIYIFGRIRQLAHAHVFTHRSIETSWVASSGCRTGSPMLPTVGSSCCDREMDAIQIFSPDGDFLEQWTDTQRPTHLTFDAMGNVYVTARLARRRRRKLAGRRWIGRAPARKQPACVASKTEKRATIRTAGPVTKLRHAAQWLLRYPMLRRSRQRPIHPACPLCNSSTDRRRHTNRKQRVTGFS